MEQKKIGKARATFRHNAPNHKKIYPKSRAVLLISVGQGYHEGEKLEAAINLINRTKFKECFIALGDAIQRHNILVERPDMTPEEAHKVANILGDEWLERNKPIYSKLQVPYKIFRWDHWLTTEEYLTSRKTIDHLYKTNELVRENFLQSADKFLHRYEKRIPKTQKIDLQKVLDISIDYLQEECTIIMSMWIKEGYDFIIYPSNMLGVISITHDTLVKPFYPNILNWLPLRFKRENTHEDNAIQS